MRFDALVLALLLLTVEGPDQRMRAHDAALAAVDAWQALADCLKPDAVEALLSERQTEVQRYLPPETEAVLRQAECVEIIGSELRARLTGGRQLSIRYIGARNTGHWYQVTHTERTQTPLVDGIVTQPSSPAAIRLRIRIGAIDADEIELWHFPDGMRFLSFKNKATGAVTRFLPQPYVEWALRIGKVVIMYDGKPGRGQAFRLWQLPPTGGLGRIDLHVRFYPLVLDFSEDSSWLEPFAAVIATPSVNLSGLWLGLAKHSLAP